MKEPYTIRDVRTFNQTPNGRKAALQMRKRLIDAGLFDSCLEDTTKIVIYTRPMVINAEWEDGDGDG